MLLKEEQFCQTIQRPFYPKISFRRESQLKAHMAENGKLCGTYLGKQRGHRGAAGIVCGWKMALTAQIPIGWSKLGWMLS